MITGIQIKRFTKAFIPFLMLLLMVSLAFSQNRQDPTNQHFVAYGLHFVAPGQTLHVSIVNLGPGRSRLIDPCFDVEFVLDVYEAAADGSVRPVSTRSVTRNAEVESGEAASFTYTPPTDPNGTTLGEFVSVKVNYVLEQTATPSPRVDVRLVPQPGITLDLSVGGASTVAFPIVSRGLAGGTPGM
jgi:hypothetical protein